MQGGIIMKNFKFVEVSIVKKEFIKSFVIFIELIIILMLMDYMNFPTFLRFGLSNINIDFCMGILNTGVIIILYLITYKVLDERTVQRENNKKEISVLLIKECYLECISYLKILNQEAVEKYIVPKVDFDAVENRIVNNLQNAPFLNESIIMDLLKDGQISKKQIETYIIIKGKFRQYINVRITFYDKEKYYKIYERELQEMITMEIKNLND